MAEQKWNGRSRGGGFGTAVFVWLIRHFGLRPAYCLLAFVAPYFVVFAPRSTAATWRFGRQVRRLGRLRSLWEVLMTYYSFGQCIIDKIAIGQGQASLFSFVHEDESPMLSLLGSGRPAVVLSAHVGAWEAGAPSFARFGKKMNVTMYQAEDARVRKAIEREAADKSFSIIPIGGDMLEAVLDIKNALDRGEFVCFMGDRFMEGSPRDVEVFMGRKAFFTSGPFEVASTMRTAVAFYFAVREPGPTYRFFFEVHEPGEGRLDYRWLRRTYLDSLERVVRRYPRQWFNLYDYWLPEERQAAAQS